MFTPKNLKTIAFATNLAWHSGSVPFHFLKEANGTWKLVFSPTRLRTFYIRAAISLNTFYVVFLIFRVLQNAVFDQLEQSKLLPFLVKMAYLLSSYSLPVVIQLNTIWKWKEMPTFLAEYLNFFQTLQKRYIVNYHYQKGVKCMKFFTTILTIGTLVTVQNTVIILKKPEQVHFLTSLLEDPRKSPLIIRVPLMIANFWVWMVTWTNIWVVCIHPYMYTACGIFIFRELDISSKSWRTTKLIREWKTSAKILRSMQVLHRNWHTNFQEWYCPGHKTCAVSIATFSLYGVIKLSGPRAIVMGFVAIFALLYISALFYKFGKLDDVSGRTLQNLRCSPKTSKWMKKFVASVPVFNVGIGRFYYMKKTTVIMVLWTVLNNTITLLFL